ncbi:mevalonate/galactokinase family protein [Tanacetum coccineum]
MKFGPYSSLNVLHQIKSEMSTLTFLNHPNVIRLHKKELAQLTSVCERHIGTQSGGMDQEADIREKEKKPSQKRQNRARNGKTWKS